MKMTLTMTMTWHVTDGDKGIAQDLADDVDRDVVHGYFSDAMHGDKEFSDLVATATVVEE